MSVRTILTFPDARLREVSQPVTDFNPELKTLVDDMIDTMYDANGIGLAAPQVGELKRVLVIDTRARDEKGRRYKYDEMTELEAAIPQPLVLINPEIVKGEGKTTFDEGCLSVPGFFETVQRFEYVELKAFDASGKEHLYKVDGLLAGSYLKRNLDRHRTRDRIDFIDLLVVGWPVGSAEDRLGSWGKKHRERPAAVAT